MAFKNPENSLFSEGVSPWFGSKIANVVKDFFDEKIQREKLFAYVVV